MANCEKLIPFIQKWEGGFANDPTDRGGATMRGITLATFRAYRKAKGGATPSVADLKNISDAEWKAVYKTMFWDMFIILVTPFFPITEIFWDVLLPMVVLLKTAIGKSDI